MNDWHEVIKTSVQNIQSIVDIQNRMISIIEKQRVQLDKNEDRVVALGAQVTHLKEVLARIGVCPECGENRSIPEGDYVCRECREQR